MDVGIVAQRGNERAQSLAGAIATALGEDVRVRVDAETAAVLEPADLGAPSAGGDDGETGNEDTAGSTEPDCTEIDGAVEGAAVAEMSDADLVVSIGGDGTFLFVAREAATAPILGVNLGEVGFLNAVAPDDAVDAVQAVTDQFRRDGSVPGRTVHRLAASGDDWSLDPALNEVIVHGPRRGHGGGARLEVRVDGEPYADGHADGVIVATPTGSTAYNLSERGPLVHPGVDALVVNGMAAVEPMPPLVAPGDAVVELAVTGADRAFAISDGRTTRELDPPTTVRVERADDPITIAGPQASFFEALEKIE